METGIYVRVSTEEQVQEGYSIRAQEQKLKDFARIKDWSIFKVYADEGISGKNITERPAINQLIKDVKSGKVKNVVVFKIDRLTRSTADLIYLVDLFNEHDCAFNSLMESIDTQTASGRMFLKIVGIFAEFERENLIERVKLGIERKVKEGFSLCKNIVSYGYVRPIGEKIQVICEDEAQIVRDVFEMYVSQGLSLRMIAKRLNMLGVPTKTGTSTWQVKTVRNMLTNCNYIGNVRHHIVKNTPQYEGEGVHEAIISLELYEEAQRLLEKNSHAGKTKRPKAENYFSGLLICGVCGEKLCAHSEYKTLQDGATSRIVRYRCPNRMLGRCNAYEIGKKNLDQAFETYIDGIAAFNVANELTLEEQQQRAQRIAEQIASYHEKRKQLEAKRKDILGRYVDNEIEFEDYNDMRHKLEHDRQFVAQELERLTEPAPEETTIQRGDIIQELKENWQHLNEPERRQFLVKFVKGIVVVNEKEEGQRFGAVRVIEVIFHKN